jgi:hypothetical protein
MVTVVRLEPYAGLCFELRTDDLQQKLAKMRESGSILIESADARANAERSA